MDANDKIYFLKWIYLAYFNNIATLKYRADNEKHIGYNLKIDLLIISNHLKIWL